MSKTVKLSLGEAQAEVSLVGAELLKLRLAGRDLLWQPDSAYWEGTSPILFPVIGRVNAGVVRIAEKTYPMPPHGFAKQRTFAVEKQATDSVVLVTAGDEQSALSYPFPFVLKVGYLLTTAGLEITFEVINTGSTPLPYAIVFHPGFRWPFGQGPKEGYSLELHVNAIDGGARQTPSGLMESQRFKLQLNNGHLPLSEKLFDEARRSFPLHRTLDQPQRSGRFRGGYLR